MAAVWLETPKNDLHAREAVSTIRRMNASREVQNALLDHDILTGASDDPKVLRLLPPLVLPSHHVDHFAETLANLVPGT